MTEELVPSSRTSLDVYAASKAAAKHFGLGVYCYRSKGERKTDGFDGFRYYVAHSARGGEQVLAFGRSFEEAIARAVWYWSPRFWPSATAFKRLVTTKRRS